MIQDGHRLTQTTDCTHEAAGVGGNGGMYDYVIVGAGSSGATLAARLSESPNVSVCLLESGPDYRSAETPVAMQLLNPFAILNTPEHSGFRYDELLARRSLALETPLYWRG